MRFEIVMGDITRFPAQAIVNAANTSLLGGGGVDGAIHRAAGPALLEECRRLGGCETGKAKLTKGYRLPAKYVIHTPGPIWRGGNAGEAELLKSCYESCLSLAMEKGITTLAFPSISTGVYRVPLAVACPIACGVILDFLQNHPQLEQVSMVCFDEQTKKAYENALMNLSRYTE